MGMKERDYSIDILKFLAVFLIINSHMDALYVKYSMLATGGAIGDVLFLFASGYTLFLSNRNLRFDNWYKRRFNRIYPSVIVCSVVGALLTYNNELSLITLAGGEFVIAIMAYYVLLYFIKRYAMKYVPLILIGIAIVALIVYILWFPYKYEVSSKGIYGITTLFRWLPYSAFMLFGAWMGGVKCKELRFNAKYDFILMISCFILFYGVQLAAKKYSTVAPYQIFTLLPLLGIVFYFWKWCNANFWKKMYLNKYGHLIIMTISGLCLESYLIQYSVFTTKMNGIFPLNLPIMVIVILIVSYICRCLARVFSQTFGVEEYDWKKVFTLV